VGGPRSVGAQRIIGAQSHRGENKGYRQHSEKIQWFGATTEQATLQCLRKTSSRTGSVPFDGLQWWAKVLRGVMESKVWISLWVVCSDNSASSACVADYEACVVSI
jgi:hypothetical protein